jgi:hypothetical protein
MAPTVPVDARLDAVVEALAMDHVAHVAVLDTEYRVVGVVAPSDLVRAYRRSLEQSLRRLGSALRGATLLEEEVGEGSEAEGRAVSDGAWPAGTAIIAIQRDKQLILPESDTRLLVGDVVSVLAPSGREDALRLAIAGSLSRTTVSPREDEMI